MDLRVPEEVRRLARGYRLDSHGGNNPQNELEIKTGFQYPSNYFPSNGKKSIRFGVMSFEYDTSQGLYRIAVDPSEWGMEKVIKISGPEHWELGALVFENLETNGKWDVRSYSAGLFEFIKNPQHPDYWWDGPAHVGGKLYSPEELRELYISLSRIHP